MDKVNANPERNAAGSEDSPPLRRFLGEWPLAVYAGASFVILRLLDVPVIVAAPLTAAVMMFYEFTTDHGRYRNLGGIRFVGELLLTIGLFVLIAFVLERLKTAS